jgi:uncharacterized Ntn-hydrolase superfamily protein
MESNFMIHPSTFSIVASDPKNRSCGIAVASKFLAAGSVVPWAHSNAGAIATQSYANTRYGPIGLQMLEQGLSAEQTLEALLAGDLDAEKRQVGIVDLQGGSATFTGNQCHNWAGGITGNGYATQGNILVGEHVIQEMSNVFENTTGNIIWRLYNALAAGDKAGGDRRGRQSAAIFVTKFQGGYAGFNDRWVDLRVDDHQDPVVRLGELLELRDLYFEKSPLDDVILLRGKQLEKMQLVMKKRGFYIGEINGKYEDQTRVAFRTFIGNENFEDRCDFDNGKIDRPVFNYIIHNKETQKDE